MTSIFARPLLPHEPRIVNELVQQELTDRYLMPVVAELEIFLLAVRTEVDAILQPRQPTKLGKPYPLGQCLEITQAVQKRLHRIDASGFDGIAAKGYAALSAFLRAGGSLRQIWGDLRGQFFQNAFLIGTLYVDVSNDTVVPTKPKVEILPFGKSQLMPVENYCHFKRIAESYWKDQVFPNHVLPELAPYCPLVNVNSFGQVRLCDSSGYMVALTRATAFQASEEVLRDSTMPADVFAFIAESLQHTKLRLASNPEQGRIEALIQSRMYRTKRWHQSDQQQDRIVDSVHDANRCLAKLVVHPSCASSVQQGIDRTGVELMVPPPSTLPKASSYVAVSKDRHANKCWRLNSSHHFAAPDTIVPLTAQELPQAVMALPVAFIASGEVFDLVAVQGLAPGRNTFVASDGRWLAAYIPAVYRTYPFKLANADDGQYVLCIDESSGLVTEGPDGETFFDVDGKPTQAVKEVLNSLTQQQANCKATAGICLVLQKHKLIQPWQLQVQTGEKTQPIEGLYRVDEAALNSLPAQAFIELRDTGALAAAYCQLLSMQNVQKLGLI
ncbi:SapC family protein [Noviherbaspirillum sp. CPCC 100848]|uniref:SapC family protein n=1 Tax=Noviherbaspirillum album TaxID=3080276 RepID=A0ABU6JJD8_9BURK|nr:SapC family protein [Noviherbaspirillum sp. CPCC 100848]MEC4723576.1 SapC family protein [Noviherbaspirillum sp. CPCC 100848]